MIEGQAAPVCGLRGEARRERGQRLEMPGLSVGHPSHYLVSAQYLRSDGWMGDGSQLRGPYITVQDPKVSFTVNMEKKLYSLMMKTIQAEENPNRSRWVREAICSRLGVSIPSKTVKHPADGEFHDWDQPE